MNNVRRKPVGGQETALQPPTMPPLEQEPPQQETPPQLPQRPVPMPAVSAENMSFAGTPVAIAQSFFKPGTETPSVEATNKPSLPRRPLPPLPPNEGPFNSQPEEPIRKTNRWSNFADGLHGKGFDSWKEKYDALAAGRHSLDSSRPQLPPRPSTERPWSSHSPGQSPTRHRRQDRVPLRDVGFTITLIRRDPTSGTQWNVATISTSRADSSAIDIEIYTPGYNRFAGSQEPFSLASLGANLPSSLPPELIRAAGASMSQSLPKGQPTEQPPTGPRKFHRQVCVSRPFEEASGGSNGPSDFGTGHGHDASSKLKSGYYVFNSPWNGTCTFSSSVNGRSLKCKHMISGPTGIPIPGESDPNPAVTVAELRFNTPFQAANIRYQAAQQNQHQHHQFPASQISSHPQNSNDAMMHDPDATSKRASFSQFLNPSNYSRQRAYSGPNSSSPTDNQRANFNPSNVIRKTSLRASRFARQNQFGHHHRRRSTSTSSGGAESDEDRLDLSLARELAGGGIRGKSAKLGKLVIEDEGFKMLDLVVAACMGVWWRGYYH